ncbi:MAG TPA: glycosyltransferase family 9 protein [Candidatus Kapabacteria bacterium]|nr:glycosyltransferase family 9 protein [Candidatus Kapabacteria bacterium]
MAAEQKTYRARAPHESSSWFKRLLKKIEYGNKFLTMRLLGKLLRITPLDKPVPLEKVSSVLIIRYDALGDMVVTTPLWRILKKLKPSIKIGVAGSYKNLDLLRADTEIDVIYDYSASSMREFAHLTKETRKRQWDVVIACNFIDRTRNAIISRLSSPTGITASIGKAGKEGADRLFSRYIVLPETPLPMSMVSKLQYLLRSTIELPASEDVRPSLLIDLAIERQVTEAISTILKQRSAASYLVINTDATAIRKWGNKNSITLANTLSEQFPDKVVFLTAMPDQIVEIQSLLEKATENRVIIFPTKNIHELIALIRGASLIITPDTSIAHIASAENKPMVGFYPIANDWLPFKIPSIIILPPHSKQIRDIPIEVAEQAAIKMLTEPVTNSIKIIHCDDLSSIEEWRF